jgi:transposase
MIAVGVDAHKHEHAICVLGGAGQVIGERTISASRQGYAELVGWIGRLPEPVVVGIEGAGSYGTGLCEQLLAAGIDVVEVERPQRAERRGGKSDRIDAQLAARNVLAGDGLSRPRCGGTRQAIGALLVAYRSCIAERTRVLNTLHALHTTAPAALREQLGSGSGKQLARRVLRLRRRLGTRTAEQITLELLRDYAERAADLTRRADIYKATLGELVQSLDRELLNEPGIGPISAAKLLVCDPQRLSGEAAFAATAPHRYPPPPARRSDTASRAAATAKPTMRSTRSRSAEPAATPRHAPTSNAACTRARPSEKPCAPSNDTSPASSTNASSRST